MFCYHYLDFILFLLLPFMCALLLQVMPRPPRQCNSLVAECVMAAAISQRQPQPCLAIATALKLVSLEKSAPNSNMWLLLDKVVLSENIYPEGQDMKWSAWRQGMKRRSCHFLMSAGHLGVCVTLHV